MLCQPDSQRLSGALVLYAHLYLVALLGSFSKQDILSKLLYGKKQNPLAN